LLYDCFKLVAYSWIERFKRGVVGRLGTKLLDDVDGCADVLMTNDGH
jgi:hypothetical protein